MTRHTVDSALRVLRAEIRESVRSYFAPVRVVAIEVSRAMHGATGNGMPSRRRFTTDGAPVEDRAKRR